MLYIYTCLGPSQWDTLYQFPNYRTQREGEHLVQYLEWGHSWHHGGNGLSRLHRVRDLGRAGEEGSGAASGKVGIPTSVCRLNEFISEHTKHC